MLDQYRVRNYGHFHISANGDETIGNIIAGYTMTYRRVFKLGDRVRIGEYIGDVHEAQLLAKLLGATPNGEPFRFVVVGEVKAGKSSFINALLGENICAVHARPCTAVIEKLDYGPQRSETRLSDHLIQKTLPVDILKTISIVDTPGTNTVIENHQEITEHYLPNSDLIIFVFYAPNPYTQTAWSLLRLIQKEWRKQLLLVMQQADRATPEEIEINLAELRAQLQQEQLAAAPIFVTSAKRELAGPPAAADSGFADHSAFARAFRRHLGVSPRAYRQMRRAMA